MLASIAALRQHSELAVRLFAAWKALGENAGREEYELDRAGFEEHLRAARASLDTRAFDAAWAAGKELTLGQALAVDVAEEKPTGPAGVEAFSTRSLNADHEPLTEREWEVAQLVARGLTNRQIAAELIVTEATAAKHVENIRAKLELTSRTQVATWLVARTARAQR